ncbi:MAG TPA: hypothetical protein VNY78_03285 [Edaphobacter sp.]|nr:hypothetical protein [Edaphobacter sp.]
MPELPSPDSVELQEFRSKFSGYREVMQSRATAYKGSQYTLEKLYELYAGLGNRARAMAETVITEWLESDDEGLRFDARALLREFNVCKKGNHES